MVLETPNLELVLESLADVRARIAAMPPDVRAQVSDEWLAKLDAADEPDPWQHGFAMFRREDGQRVGECGFTGPPNPEGIVEIAYYVHEAWRSRGYATEAAAALTEHALGQGVRIVRAHTLAELNASTRVLHRCGFRHLGEVIHPEDGRVWRWERMAPEA